MAASTSPQTLPQHVDVLVVGAGLTGIGMGYHLQTLQPGKTFAILEARNAIGGTWDLFRYPGIRSDTDLYAFGYGFKWNKDNAIANADEILDYLQEAIDENQLGAHIHLGHKVVSADFSTVDAKWTVVVERVGNGERFEMTSNFLKSAAGYYDVDEGYSPRFKGRDALPRRDRSSATLARRPRLRRQEGRHHRQRCYSRDSGARNGRDG